MIDQTTRKYFYEMSHQDVTKLILKVNSLKLGMAANEVLRLLGEPTVDYVGADKRTGRFIVRIVKYYVKRLDKGLVNEKHDKLIYLFFDERDQLVEISSNVEGVSDKKTKYAYPPDSTTP